ncbi:hypothetical protein N0V83_003483 [Neocucurbitaria cava]|uniref:Transmembrane protein n=1 Tax=Neocucurbitaria cava TaxID=798079 RepID=A0A9W8YBH7_9PLEO|nr:hypothetical protein N0V83_003483 [Neocucurbitaria cava]
MAPQQHGLEKHGDEPPRPPEDEEESGPPLSDSASTVDGTMATLSSTDITDYASTGHRPPYTEHPGYASNAWTGWPYDGFPSSTASWVTETKTPYGDNGEISTSSKTPELLASNDISSPSATATDESGGQHPGWPRPSAANNAPMYAAASIVPIVVLAIIGCIAFCCLRKRKRQRERSGLRMTAQEMKMHPQATARPYMAPPAVSPQYAVSPSQPPPTSDPSAPPPVILGPISSGANGAYLTGIDTSDVISVTSNNLRPIDPFADNHSLTEPPPPYRPRSIPPPSFVSASRQSSFRSPQPAPATSQTHLIERSPFDDPEDDGISEVSGPTLGHGDDAMSAVSDLSYQQDPVVGRSSLA